MSAVDVRIPADELAASTARDLLDRVAEDVPKGVLDNARLLVSELVTNCIRHAGLPQDGEIELVVAVSPERVRVEVRDQGQGFLPDDVTPSMYQTSGWGLYLVQQIADRWGVSPLGGTCVWFELDRRLSNRS